MLPGKDAAGRPKKREFGPWIGRLYPVLARLKALRGTPLDVFGYSAERRMERGLIRQYQADMAEFLPKADAGDHGRARGAGRAAALHPRLRPGQGAQRAACSETARRPDRASAGGRRDHWPRLPSRRPHAGHRAPRTGGPSVFSVFLER
jgi:hypothetical protein